ncbi:hypothetical protein C8R46DRAFT_1125788 [Mycena filopes]|nr:hypothetical protein C8R46DRAFT_1125788 [Mycena filopes]
MDSSVSGTPTATTSDGAASSTSTCLSTGSLCGVTSPGTLYLFTFLCTLFLLIMVAGGVVSRSMYLRRRERRLMATGEWVPPSRRAAIALEANIKMLKKKPIMYEVEFGLEDSEVIGESPLRNWDAMMPLAARYQAPPPVPPPIPAPPAMAMASPAPPRLRGILSRPGIFKPHPPLAVELPAIIPRVMVPSSRPLQATYVIAMPIEWRGDDAVGRLPYFEVGTTSVEVVGSPADEMVVDGDGRGLEKGKVESSSPA